MKKSHSTKAFCMQGIYKTILIILFSVFFIGACKSAQKNNVDSDPSLAGQPADVQSQDLNSGLAVFYKEGFWRHIHQMPSTQSFLKVSPGKPIMYINHRFGDGEVFGSGKTRGIGVQMMGYLHLPQKGQWEFQAKSNDGIDIKIAQTQVVFDPGQHSDQLSKPMSFQAPKPGMYPIIVRYFQRKGTATLQFYWKPPGSNKFSIIPASAYKHRPRQES